MKYINGIYFIFMCVTLYYLTTENVSINTDSKILNTTYNNLISIINLNYKNVYLQLGQVLISLLIILFSYYIYLTRTKNKVASPKLLKANYIKKVEISKSKIIKFCTQSRYPLTNYYQNTNIKGSFIKIIVGSFLYEFSKYLTEWTQIWCISVGIIQIIFDNTYRSFIPLMIFTIFQSILYTYTQYKILKDDVRINSRSINYIDKKEDILCKQSKDIVKGDRIVVDNNNNWIPVDMVITNIKINDIEINSTYINEVEVNGESRPNLKMKIKKNIDTIQILNNEIFINQNKEPLDEKYIAFGNSYLVSLNNNVNIKIEGIACNISYEKKTLKKSEFKKNTYSPFIRYSNFGFYISLVVLIILSVISSIISYHYHLTFEKYSFYTYFKIWVKHISYINMIVPQAMQQLYFFSTLLSTYNTRSNVITNKHLDLDKLYNISTILSDKTGTLTLNNIKSLGMSFVKYSEFNKIKNEYQHIEPAHTNNESNSTNINNESNTGINLQNKLLNIHTPHISNKILENITDYHLEIISVIINCNIDPEEIAIKNKLKSLGVDIISNIPIILNNTGFMKLKIGNIIWDIEIHIDFGLWIPLLSKGYLVKIINTNTWLLCIQAGGDQFWENATNNLKLKTKEYTMQILKYMDEDYHNSKQLFLPESKIGCYRNWSHGLNILSEKDATIIINNWNNICNPCIERNNIEKNKLKYVTSLFYKCKLVSKSYLIDLYRPNIDCIIRDWINDDKIFIIVTGDSLTATKEISNYVIPSVRLNNKNIEYVLGETLDLNDNVKKEQYCIDLFKKICKLKEKIILYIDEKWLEILQDDYISILLNNIFKSKYGHSIMFYRMSPESKSKVSQIINKIKKKDSFSLSIGDGFNDIPMLKTTDISIAIKSGETEDVCKVASFAVDRFEEIRTLIDIDSFEKIHKYGRLIRMAFVKQWMMALSLYFYLIFIGYPLYPKDSSNPLLVMLYNTLIFFGMIAQASSDKNPYPENLKYQINLSKNKMIRWMLGAGIYGSINTLSILFYFTDSGYFTHSTFVQNPNLIPISAYLLICQSIAILNLICISSYEWSSKYTPLNNFIAQCNCFIKSIHSKLISVLILLTIIKFTYNIPVINILISSFFSGGLMSILYIMY